MARRPRHPSTAYYPLKRVRFKPQFFGKNPAIKKKGYPRFKKSRSVEYKTTGYKLSEDRQSITFTDGFKAGSFRMTGAFDLNYYQPKQIKRVRVVRRADGYYAQFCVAIDRLEEVQPTEQVIALDVGLMHFYTDNRGNKESKLVDEKLNQRFDKFAQSLVENTRKL